MTTSRIKAWIVVGLLLAFPARGETLYQKEGITLEGSVRMVHRNAATCQVLEENESAESYERTKSNHGRPLHVWRLDYSALNGSGQSLSDLTAHFQIRAEWPPCTNWTGLGMYPGPVQWSGSFETIQRTGGMRPGQEAAATAWVLAFDGQEPSFGRRQVTYRFGEASGPEVTETAAPVAPPVEPQPPPLPDPRCKGEQTGDKCWLELASHPGCYVWEEFNLTESRSEWSGECVERLAEGTGTLTQTWRWSTGGTGWSETTGLMRAGKQEGPWVYRGSEGQNGECQYVDGKKHGLCIHRQPAYKGKDLSLASSVEETEYAKGKRHGRSVTNFGNGARYEGQYIDDERHGVWLDRDSSGKVTRDHWIHGELQR